jgi:hypothetical protein
VRSPRQGCASRRDWRRNCPTPDEQYRYLKLCGPERLRALFRVEVNAEVLREALAVLEACWLGHGGAAEEAEEAGGRSGHAALREAAFVVEALAALAGAHPAREPGRLATSAQQLAVRQHLS